jgi:hypothetical protein
VEEETRDADLERATADGLASIAAEAGDPWPPLLNGGSMLDRLRTPLFIVAAIVMLLVIGAESGSVLLPGNFDTTLLRAQTADALRGPEFDRDRGAMIAAALREGRRSPRPPGVGIRDMALLDGLMLYAVLLMGFALLFPERTYGRVQGIVTLVASLLVLLAAIVLLLDAVEELFTMVGLLCAAPFGTIAYLVRWGFFNRGGAAAVLGLTFVLKVAFIVLLALAHQRFLQNKGLVRLVITSLACSFVISLLHGLVPIFLVSITDAIGGLIALVLAIVWGVVLLIGAVTAVVKAII